MFTALGVGPLTKQIEIGLNASERSKQAKQFLLFSNHKSHIFHMFTYILHIQFPGISWNYFIFRKLPGNDQDFPEFRKFPSKWKHWFDTSVSTPDLHAISFTGGSLHEKNTVKILEPKTLQFRIKKAKRCNPVFLLNSLFAKHP